MIPEDDTVLRTGAMVGVVGGIYWLFNAALASQHLISVKEIKMFSPRAKSETNDQPQEAAK